MFRCAGRNSTLAITVVSRKCLLKTVTVQPCRREMADCRAVGRQAIGGQTFYLLHFPPKVAATSGERCCPDRFLKKLTSLAAGSDL